MHSTSFLILGGAATIGAAALYLAIQFGLNASDEFASELAVTSDEYLKLRAQAVALGKDASKIKGNAAHTKRPAGYQDALTNGLNAPYLRPDSDARAEKSLSTFVLPKNTNYKNLTSGNRNTGGSSSSGYSRDSDQKVAEKAGLTEQELGKLFDQVVAKEKSGRFDKSSDINTGNGLNFSVNSPPAALDVDAVLAKGNYTVDDEIRYQLATEEMSDKKRAIMESLLPKEKPKAIRAVNVILEFDSKNCVVPRNSNSLIGVMFRSESEAIRGSSLNDLDELISMRERCDGRLLVEDHAEAASESDVELRQSRRDEVKYYLLQRQVPKESIVISSL